LAKRNPKKPIKRRKKMMIKLLITDDEKELMVNALAEHGKPLVKKEKPTRQERKTLDSLEKIIHQLVFGNEH